MHVNSDEIYVWSLLIKDFTLKSGCKKYLGGHPSCLPAHVSIDGPFLLGILRFLRRIVNNKITYFLIFFPHRSSRSFLTLPPSLKSSFHWSSLKTKVKFRVRKWKLQRERDLNYPCVKFILVPTMTNQLKEPRFCPTLAPPRLLMVKSFNLKKKPTKVTNTQFLYKHSCFALNNFSIKNVYQVCILGILHAKIPVVLVKIIPESNLSLHRGVWKNSYFDRCIQSSWKLIRTWEVGVFF